jgi:pyridoxal phosphate enzyme (YggS family)
VSAVSTARERELLASLTAVRARLERAAADAGRNVGEIELLPVTKFFPASDVLLLHAMGCTEFGESREQEASGKAAEVGAELSGEPVRWHMVGRIQRNKVRRIAEWAHAAHSVDDLRVAAALDRAVGLALDEGRRAQPLQVYLQISLDGDAGRSGVDVRRPDLVDELADAVDAAASLRLVGVMGIPPLDADADAAFATLAAERDRVQQRCGRPLGLSAGMSGDLENAVRHGSTCLRVGTALMGRRPLTSP